MAEKMVKIVGVVFFVLLFCSFIAGVGETFVTLFTGGDIVDSEGNPQPILATAVILGLCLFLLVVALGAAVSSLAEKVRNWYHLFRYRHGEGKKWAAEESARIFREAEQEFYE